MKADEHQSETSWSLWGGYGYVSLERKDAPAKGSRGILEIKENKTITLKKGEVAHFWQVWAKKL